MAPGTAPWPGITSIKAKTRVFEAILPVLRPKPVYLRPFYRVLGHFTVFYGEFRVFSWNFVYFTVNFVYFRGISCISVNPSWSISDYLDWPKHVGYQKCRF